MKRMEEIRQALKQPLSRSVIDKIVSDINNVPQDFNILYMLIKDKDSQVSWRAAWACEKLCDLHPSWFVPSYNEIIIYVISCKHPGTKRLLLSILFKLPLPQILPISLYDFCLLQMLSPLETASVQSLCIKLAYKIGKAQPELLHELECYLRNANSLYYSPGVNHSIQKIIKTISTYKIE